MDCSEPTWNRCSTSGMTRSALQRSRRSSPKRRSCTSRVGLCMVRLTSAGLPVTCSSSSDRRSASRRKGSLWDTTAWQPCAGRLANPISPPWFRAWMRLKSSMAASLACGCSWPPQGLTRSCGEASRTQGHMLRRTLRRFKRGAGWLEGCCSAPLRALTSAPANQRIEGPQRVESSDLLDLRSAPAAWMAGIQAVSRPQSLKSYSTVIGAWSENFSSL